MDQPVTEQSNPLTKNIDVAAPTDIVSLLHDADQEIFNHEKGLLNEQLVAKLETIAGVLAKRLEVVTKNEDEGTLVVLSGCGTSGRQAFAAARSYNSILRQHGFRKPVFDYVIAGHDEALFVSRELAEDDPHIGRRDLETRLFDFSLSLSLFTAAEFLCNSWNSSVRKISSGRSHIIYVGITCGLSAPYVAGQLDCCMENTDRFLPILVGFNPVSTARNVRIENWDKTFFDVAKRLETLEVEGKSFIVNPIIGPEPITGSTRMKGGTATKIILDTIFIAAFFRLFHDRQNLVFDVLTTYQTVEKVAFENVDRLAAIVQSVAKSLSSGSHIYYVSSCKRLALCGLIDASECPPTYGADFEDVRCFLTEGYQALGNRDGDLESKVPISTKYFEEQVLPRLKATDTVVIISSGDSVYWNESLGHSSARKILLQFSSTTAADSTEQKLDNADLPQDLTDVCNSHRVTLDDSVMASLFPIQSARTNNFASMLFLEIACKLTCNVLTTGGHVMKGKVYENYMIDVKVSNNKLYHRALAIVQKFGQCDHSTAVDCLLKAMYDTDDVTDDAKLSTISDHIQHAAKRKQIVPVAILLARLSCPVRLAKQLLAECPVVRQVIAKLSTVEAT